MNFYGTLHTHTIDRIREDDPTWRMKGYKAKLRELCLLDTPYPLDESSAMLFEELKSPHIPDLWRAVSNGKIDVLEVTHKNGFSKKMSAVNTLFWAADYFGVVISFYELTVPLGCVRKLCTTSGRYHQDELSKYLEGRYCT